MPCFSCNAITVSSICPCITSNTSHRIENEAQKGPGILLIGEKYRRRIAVVATKRATGIAAYARLMYDGKNIVENSDGLGPLFSSVCNWGIEVPVCHRSAKSNSRGLLRKLLHVQMFKQEKDQTWEKIIV